MARALATLAPIATAVLAAPAMAQEREYCPQRPGLDTPACIVDRGHVSVETALVDWALDRQADSRTDTVLIGETLIRLGISDTAELHLGWTPYGHQRVRDRQTGAIDRIGRSGDVSLGLKASLLNPDGSGMAVAVSPYVTLPVGGKPIGGGAVGAGVVLPVTYEVSDAVQLDATPRLAAQPNDERSGRHLHYSAAAGVTFKLTDAVTLSPEMQVIRDDDPDDRSTQALAALSLAWQPGEDWQLDMIGIAGLNRDAPDVELALGISRRF